METTDRLIVKGVVFFTEGENKYKMVTTVSLDDECRNNIYRWGIYADIYWRGKNGIYKKYATGALSPVGGIGEIRMRANPRKIVAYKDFAKQMVMAQYE